MPHLYPGMRLGKDPAWHETRQRIEPGDFGSVDKCSTMDYLSNLS